MWLPCGTAFLLLMLYSSLRGADGCQRQECDVFECAKASEVQQKLGACKVALTAAKTDLQECRSARSTARPTTTTIPPRKDCFDIYLAGERKNGVYTTDDGKEVRCDMQNGGWTYIFEISREDKKLFSDNNKWSKYRNGFGNVSGAHWLGNEYVHQLSKSRDYAVKFSLEEADGILAEANYFVFRVNSEATNYALFVDEYSGTAGNLLQCNGAEQNAMQFSTADRDNDLDWKNCARTQGGGFWYNRCCVACLMKLQYIVCGRGNLVFATRISMKIKPVSIRFNLDG